MTPLGHHRYQKEQKTFCSRMQPLKILTKLHRIIKFIVLENKEEEILDSKSIAQKP